jgi:hypothetical protein
VLRIELWKKENRIKYDARMKELRDPLIDTPTALAVGVSKYRL